MNDLSKFITKYNISKNDLILLSELYFNRKKFKNIPFSKDYSKITKEIRLIEKKYKFSFLDSGNIVLLIGKVPQITEDNYDDILSENNKSATSKTNVNKSSISTSKSSFNYIKYLKIGAVLFLGYHGVKYIIGPSACECANIYESKYNPSNIDYTAEELNDEEKMHDDVDYFVEFGRSCVLKYGELSDIETELVKSARSIGDMPNHYEAISNAKKKCN
jgi:hypothetical protein